MLRDWPTIVRVTDHYRAVIAGVEREAKERMKDFPPCHDWWHIERVRKIGRHIALVEGADLYLVDLALLMHELGAPKFNKGGPPSSEIAREILRRETHSSVVVESVCSIIHNMVFRNRGTFGPMPTLEGGVAQDADMLDAMGAIGIARVFTTGAHKNQPLFVPGKQTRTQAEVLMSSQGPASTVAHFYEKLLLLKDRMNTKEGKKLAKRRHRVLSKFLYDFRQEWDLEG